MSHGHIWTWKVQFELYKSCGRKTTEIQVESFKPLGKTKDQEPFCCEATVLTTEPDQTPTKIHQLYSVRITKYKIAEGAGVGGK